MDDGWASMMIQRRDEDIGVDRYTDRHHELATIVGSRQVKSVEHHEEGSC